MEILEDNFFLGVELEELESETEKGRGFLVGVLPADVGELHRAVTQRGGVEGEGAFFPVEGFEDAFADDFFDEEEGVDAVDGGARVGAAGVEEGFGVC